MVSKYIKIAKYEQGVFVESFLEPLNSLAVALENEVNEDMEEGQEIRLTSVELEQDEYEAIATYEGYL